MLESVHSGPEPVPPCSQKGFLPGLGSVSTCPLASPSPSPHSYSLAPSFLAVCISRVPVTFSPLFPALGTPFLCYFVPFLTLNSSAVDRYQVHGRLCLSGKHALVEKQRGAGGGVCGPEVRVAESTQRRIQPPRKDLTGTALHWVRVLVHFAQMGRDLEKEIKPLSWVFSPSP